ncbi:hypothetical protein [Paenibacillus alvei]|uniref:hypothetical protein n=1 Tax=Paenibacillus alvei TaxID=44250 RepID=UPI0018CF4CF6|nr:hypothetical protein [Paenibacillus alvei]MBG9734183.1 hypothetical protein [Paenibacillus alvei]MBG9744548.1 hypothetical protein [Paenibacillus alvei]MCY9581741.1 hypothetical protein [Paenibacillus alvei]MCY9588352.1 hypothetical protein [Paenibacillus alvei]
MDSKHEKTEVEICKLHIKLNTSLRGKTFNESIHLEPIVSLVEYLSTEKAAYVSRKFLKHFDFTYSSMISEMEYHEGDQRNKLRSAIKTIERMILDFLDVSLSQEEPEYEFISKLEGVRRDQSYKTQMIEILNEIFLYALNKQCISKKLAYSLFLIVIDLVNESGYLTEPFKNWGEMLDSKNTAFNHYVSFYEVIEEIFGHGVRL